MAEASKWPFQSTSLNSLTCYLSASIVVDGEDQHMASESRSVTDIAFFITCLLVSKGLNVLINYS